MVIEDSGDKDLKFKSPERLLLVVTAFIFWSVGFIDLLGHTSAQPDIFGLYSLPFFIFILLYGSTVSIWIALFISPKLLSHVVDGIRYVQRRSWLVISALIGLGLILWVILEWDRWSRLPGLQLSAFGLVLLTAAILIFSGWRKRGKAKRWRKWIAAPLMVLIALEAIIQVIALIGALPGTYHIGGNFVPYERIYQNQEGFRNGVANRYGWYYPDSNLNNGAKRIVIFGTSQAQALQILPEQQFGSILSELINQNRPDTHIETEVITIGLPGFGLSPGLYDAYFEEFIYELKPDEVIILFHLGNDFQGESSSNEDVVYTVDNQGSVNIDPRSARLRHDLSHYFLRGYLSFQLVETLRSHYLTPKVVSNLFDQQWGSAAMATEDGSNGFSMPRLRGFVTDKYALTESTHAGIIDTGLEKIPDGNNFMFKKEESDAANNAVAIAASLLKLGQEYATDIDFTLRVVTVPQFPKAFYAQFQDDAWRPELSDYDLFLPERALSEIAQEEALSFLPMGQQMYNDKLATGEIKDFYFSDGQGHLTPTGHHYFANAIFSCFFANNEKGELSACTTN